MQKSGYIESDLEKFRQAHEALCRDFIEDAIDHLQELTCKSPHSSGYWHALGTAYGKAERHEESLNAYAMAQRTRVCRSQPLQQLAHAFMAAGDQNNAKHALNHLYQLRPDLVEEIEPQLD